MKTTLTKLIAYSLLLLFPLWGLGGCNNDDDAPQNPINQLPPATMTGENTIGCLLDGEAFLPGNNQNSHDCVYQYVDGGYYFTLQLNKRDNLNNRITIALLTNGLEIIENNTYFLVESSYDNASGVYSYINNQSYTNAINTGELTIAKLDFENQIVSGTFWFDVEDHNGVVHEIREGRFDMPFTQ